MDNDIYSFEGFSTTHLQGSYGQPLSTAALVATAAPATARPMTSSAGFKSGKTDNQPDVKGPAPPLEETSVVSLEAEAAKIEVKINSLLEESTLFCLEGDAQKGLEKAKLAVTRERQLSEFRTKHKLEGNASLLAYCLLTLAYALEKCGRDNDALAALNQLVKKKVCVVCVFDAEGVARIAYMPVLTAVGSFGGSVSSQHWQHPLPSWRV